MLNQAQAKYLDPSWQYTKAEDTVIRKTFLKTMKDMQRTVEQGEAIDKLVNSWFLTNIAA